MGDKVFAAEEFSGLVFKEDGINKNFLKQWINVNCVIEEGCSCDFCICYPLQWAADAGYLDVVKYLVENGADITTDDNYAVRWAATQGHLDVVKYLLNTFIYSEKDIHGCTDDWAGNSTIRDLMINYKQFSYVKAIK